MKHPPKNIKRALNNATSWNLLVWESDIGAHAKLIACYLRTYMNDYQEIAFPSVAKMAGYCAVSENTVRKALKELCSTGHLIPCGVNLKYGTNQYQIGTPSGAEPLQEVNSTPSGAEPYLTKELTNNIYKGFKPPSVEEVKDYSSTIDAERFVDFYECKGWMVGRNRMKDWKAAARNWERNNAKTGLGRNTTAHQPKLTPAQRTAAKRKSLGERNASDMGAMATNERDVRTPVGLTTGR